MKEYQAGLGLGIKEYGIIFVFTDSDLQIFVQSAGRLGTATAVADDGISGGALEGAIHVDNGVWMYQMTTKVWPQN